MAGVQSLGFGSVREMGVFARRLFDNYGQKFDTGIIPFNAAARGLHLARALQQGPAAYDGAGSSCHTAG
jgi:hypothetical protein